MAVQAVAAQQNPFSLGLRMSSIVSYKPVGYTSLAPYLSVEGAQRTVEFLATVFGAERLRAFPGSDGRIAHAELRLDDTVLMLTDATEEWPASRGHVHMYVPNVDDVFARAIAAGAAIVQVPVQKSDPDRRGGFTDPGGTTWWVSTQVG